jgi:hypothetical protein
MSKSQLFRRLHPPHLITLYIIFQLIHNTCQLLMTIENFSLLPLNITDECISLNSKLRTHAIRIQSHIDEHTTLPLHLILPPRMLFSGGSVWLFLTIHLLCLQSNFNGIVVVNIATSKYDLITSFFRAHILLGVDRRTDK